MKDMNTPEIEISSVNVGVEKEICDVSGGVAVNVGVDVGFDVGFCNAVESGNHLSKNDEALHTDVVEEALHTASSESPLLSCVVCGCVESLKFCSGCKTTHYCSKSCQV